MNGSVVRFDMQSVTFYWQISGARSPPKFDTPTDSVAIGKCGKLSERTDGKCLFNMQSDSGAGRSEASRFDGTVHFREKRSPA
jgi:hypothetical protein